MILNTIERFSGDYSFNNSLNCSWLANVAGTDDKLKQVEMFSKLLYQMIVCIDV